MDLLNHKNSDNTWEDVSGDFERYWFQLINIRLLRGSNFFKENLLKERSEKNLKKGRKDIAFCLTNTKGWFSTHERN